MNQPNLTITNPESSIPDSTVPLDITTSTIIAGDIFCNGNLYGIGNEPADCATNSTTTDTITIVSPDTTNIVAVRPKQNLPATGAGETVSIGGGAAIALALGATLIGVSRRRPKNKA